MSHKISPVFKSIRQKTFKITYYDRNNLGRRQDLGIQPIYSCNNSVFYEKPNP